MTLQMDSMSAMFDFTVFDFTVGAPKSSWSRSSPEKTLMTKFRIEILTRAVQDVFHNNTLVHLSQRGEIVYYLVCHHMNVTYDPF